jgi:hypothetical protein
MSSRRSGGCCEILWEMSYYMDSALRNSEGSTAIRQYNIPRIDRPPDVGWTMVTYTPGLVYRLN